MVEQLVVTRLVNGQIVQQFSYNGDAQDIQTDYDQLNAELGGEAKHYGPHGEVAESG